MCKLSSAKYYLFLQFSKLHNIRKEKDSREDGKVGLPGLARARLFVQAKWTLDDSYAAAAGGTKLKGRRPKFPERERPEYWKTLAERAADSFGSRGRGRGRWFHAGRT